MNVSVLIATFGDNLWKERAARAVESARGQTRNVAHLHAHMGMTLAETRNALGRTATGDWLCFLDADDELEPGYLDTMAATYQESLFTPVAHAVAPLLVPKLRRVQRPAPRHVQQDRQHPRDIWGAEIPNKGRWPAVNECVIGTLVHRRLFEQIGGFRDRTDDGTIIDLYEDWDLWLRCWDAGARLVYTDAVYREHVNESGRNYSPSAQVTYDAIWRDHEDRCSHHTSYETDPQWYT